MRCRHTSGPVRSPLQVGLWQWTPRLRHLVQPTPHLRHMLHLYLRNPIKCHDNSGPARGPLLEGLRWQCTLLSPKLGRTTHYLHHVAPSLIPDLASSSPPSDQVPSKFGPSPGPPAGGPLSAVDASILLSSIPHNFSASFAVSLAPYQTGSSSHMVSEVKPIDQVHAQLGPCTGPPPGGPSVTAGFPMLLPGTTPNWPASSTQAICSSSDQAPPQFGPCPVPPLGGIPLALGAPTSLPDTTHTVP